MSQTTVAEPVKGLEGLLFDLGNTDIMSYSAEGAIPFGKFVALGTDKETQCKLPTLASDITVATHGIGLSLRTQDLENPMEGSLDPVGTYPDEFTVSCMKKGRAWVMMEDAFTTESSVYVRYADGTVVDNNGGFRTDADTASAASLPNCRILNSGAAGELAIIDFSLL